MQESAYDDLFNAEDKHWWYLGLYDLVQLSCRRLFIERSLRILDLGCGTGGLLNILANNGYKVKGVDISENALAYCRKRGLKRLILANLNDWSPETDRYDVITCMDVLYHDWIKDEVQILKSLSNGLKREGILILNLPAFPILQRGHDNVVMGKRRYTKSMIYNNLSRSQLVPILFTYRLPHAYFPLLLKRLLEVVRGRTAHSSDIKDISCFNPVLYAVNRLENRIILNGLSLPFGTSVFVIARKMANNHIKSFNSL